VLRRETLVFYPTNRIVQQELKSLRESFAVSPDWQSPGLHPGMFSAVPAGLFVASTSTQD
jgi:hypothetical protein